MRRLALFVLLVVATGGAGFEWAHARGATIVEATVRDDIAVDVRPDGVVAVTEQLLVDPADVAGATFQRALPVVAGTAVRVLEISDHAGVAIQGAGSTDLGDQVVVTLPAPTDGPRGYVLRYDVTGPVRAHADVAELGWRLFDDRNRLVLADLRVDVSWAADAGSPLLVAMEVQGDGGAVVERPGGLRWDAGALGAHRTAEIHAAFALSAVDQLPPAGAAALDAMRAEAAGQGDMADAMTMIADRGVTFLPLLLAAAALLAWGVAQATHGAEHRVGSTAAPPARTDKRPSGHTPAEVGWLLRFGAVRVADVSATVIDLAGRGVCVLEEVGSGRQRLVRATTPPAELRPHERTVLDWLFPIGHADLDLVARTADISAQPDRWQRFWLRFKQQLTAQGQDRALVTRSVEAESVLGVGIAGALLLVLGVIGVAQGRPTWLACIVVGAFVMVVADTFAQRSPAGAELAARWRVFGCSVTPGDLAYALPAGRFDTVVAALSADPTTRATADQALVIAAAVRGWHDAHVAATSLNAEPSARLRAALARTAPRSVGSAGRKEVRTTDVG